MGARVQHLCPKCSYSAEVSGGPDSGLECGTQTFACLTCKELFNLVTVNYTHRRPRKTPRCPNSKEHNMVPWASDDPCPKCGTTMQPRPDLGFSLWD